MPAVDPLHPDVSMAVEPGRSEEEKHATIARAPLRKAASSVDGNMGGERPMLDPKSLLPTVPEEHSARSEIPHPSLTRAYSQGQNQGQSQSPSSSQNQSQSQSQSHSGIVVEHPVRAKAPSKPA